MKKVFGIIAVVSAILMSGCSGESNNIQSNSSNSVVSTVNKQQPKKTVNSEKYVYKNKKINIKIRYPILEDESKKVNEIIKKRFLISPQILEEFDNADWDMDYEIISYTDKYLSVSVKGIFIHNSSPTNIYYTVNIDLANQKIISLMDIASDTKSIVKSIYEYEPKDEVQTEALKYIKENYSYDDLYKLISNADIMQENPLECGDIAFSAFSENNIYISVPVIHVLGDYMIFNIGR